MVGTTGRDGPKHELIRGSLRIPKNAPDRGSINLRWPNRDLRVKQPDARPMQVLDLKAIPIEQFPDRIECEEPHVSGVEQPLLPIRELPLKQTQADTSVRNVWQ